ncbi:portal protein [Halomonas sp. V046]|uniref:portal protein n=1 Tax=Halomonas sp. V046 TaxID=3459611 RepID=UPI004045121D
MPDHATVEMTDDIESMEDEKQRLGVMLSSLGSKLSQLAGEQVSSRQLIETRWLNDLRQYHGEYTADELARMQESGTSSIYVNLTRNKTRAAIARLSDMLLPNDDRNWGIKPTPEPQLSVLANSRDPAEKDQARQQRERAEQKARLMQTAIDDDFTEARYNGKARDVIGDSCLLGTGVLKGPVVVNRQRRAWRRDENSGLQVMEVQKEFRAGLERVDAWDFFPDMSAATMEEAEFGFERKLLNKKQMRELSNLPGVIDNQLRKVLETDPDGTHISQDRRDELRHITGVDTVANNKRWELWEYWGPLDKEELIAAGVQIDEDPLAEYSGCVLFVGEHVIKAAINPLDSGELPWSVHNWEEDPSSIFGFGVPFLMRNPQKVASTAWRMIMDNAGLSAGPQIAVDKSAVYPQDGDWRLRPRKVWISTGKVPLNQAFYAYNIPSNQGDLYSIFQAAQQLADTETNLPILLQGEGAGGGPGAKTYGGMQMLMNNSNIVLRSAVKNYDDGITEPVVRRFYDWHMAYDEREEIKGDFSIVARGSSVLIARQEQQEKLLALAQIAASNPEFAQSTEWQGLYREIVRSMSVSADNVLKDEETIEQEKQQAGQQMPPEMQLKQMELQLKQQEQQMKGQELKMKAQRDQADYQLRVQEQQFQQQYKSAELQSQQERDRAELALKQNLTLAQLEAKLGLESQKLELQMRETSAKLQTQRDAKAAELTDRQNERHARQQNMNQGFDSYG